VLKSAPHIIVRRRRAESHSGHHGGAWKVAYADFVTAMMAFFMVMWLVNQDPSVKKAIAGYFRDPGAFPTQKSDGVLDGSKTGVGGEPAQPQAPSRQATGTVGTEQKSFSETEERIKGALQQVPEIAELRDQVEMSITPEGLRIELVDRPGSSFFASGSAILLGAGEKILAIVAQEISKLDNDIIMEGHTDSQPYSPGAKYGNWELSSDRANAARRVSELNGLQPKRVRAVYGRADTQPHIVNDPADPRNRRVSILVRSKFLPAIDGITNTGDAFNPLSREPGAKPPPAGFNRRPGG
jgi:chemotaxis protein MotB